MYTAVSAFSGPAGLSGGYCDTGLCAHLRLTSERRNHLVKQLRIDRRTLKRWVTWWREQLPMTPFWRALKGRFSSPLADLPGALLGVIERQNLPLRLAHVLALLMPLTTGSCTHCPRVTIDPQKMHLSSVARL